ncbi:MAG: hypothetical protein AAFN74_04975 [Myxococcota bacterium]
MKKVNTRAGFTMTELLVGTAIGIFTLSVAVQLASDQSQMLGRTSRSVDTMQSARRAIELLAEDLRHAGMGIGYRPSGEFGGLIRGNFTVPGGAQFVSDGFTQTLATGNMATDDLGIRVAQGDLRTIASFFGSLGQICGGSDIEVGDTVVLLSREALHAQTARIMSLTGAPCTKGQCLNGCQSFTYVSDPSYVSDNEATTANYVGGSMVGDFAEIVWFVVPGSDGSGELRRALVTQQDPCSARDSTCGGLVAEDIETLQVAIWQWDDTLNQWVNQTPTSALADRRRVRVDLEVVVRGTADDQAGARLPIALTLDQNRCMGGPCGGAADKYQRVVVRTSIEVRNGGRMLIR